MTLLVKPASYLCNLDCTYCFYKETRALYPGPPAPKMTLPGVEALVQQAVSTRARHIVFVWQGGEPTLMGLDFYRQVREFQKHCQQPGQAIENALQTNGILLDADWCRFLAKENFLTGISLDGPKEIHDRYRVQQNGAGSFDRVMAAAERLRSHGAPFNILAMVTRSGARRPEEIYAFFKKRKFTHLQFIPWYGGNGAEASPARGPVSARDLARFYTGLFDKWIVSGFPKMSVRYFEEILSACLDGACISCWCQDQCRSYVVVEHNGDLFPCDFFVRREWRLGNIHDQGLAACLESPRRLAFSAIKARLPAACQTCSLAPMCNGDCIRYRGAGPGGSTPAPSDYCETLKQVVDHVAPHLPRIRTAVEKIRSGRGNTGRNAPCPCGSGRKYKKCCGKGRAL